MAVKWTDEETEQLRLLYRTTLKVGEIARRLGRPLRAVYAKAHKIGLQAKEDPKKIRLSGEEIEWLRKAFPHVRNEVCALRLNISARSVTRIARGLNLHKTPEFIRDCQRKTSEAAKASHLKNGTYPPKGVVNENIKKGEAYQFKPGNTYGRTKHKKTNERSQR